jgi:hypothetical protein
VLPNFHRLFVPSDKAHNPTHTTRQTFPLFSSLYTPGQSIHLDWLFFHSIGKCVHHLFHCVPFGLLAFKSIDEFGIIRFPLKCRQSISSDVTELSNNPVQGHSLSFFLLRLYSSWPKLTISLVVWMSPVCCSMEFFKLYVSMPIWILLLLYIAQKCGSYTHDNTQVRKDYTTVLRE